ncbi:MAG: hypothetical protein WC303_02315, partial [Candidatus Paceibacterota bacterium]
MDSFKLKREKENIYKKKEEVLALWMLALIFGVIAFIVMVKCWYFAIPVVLVCIFWKKIRINKKNKFWIIVDKNLLIREIKNIFKIKDIHKISQMFIFILTLIVIVFYWYFSIPIFLIWWIWEKMSFNKKNKIIITCFLVLIIVLTPFYINYSNRVVTIKSIFPQDGFTVQSEQVLIKGVIDPVNATVKINDILIPVKNGVFEYNAALLNEENNFNIFIINKNIQSTAINKNIKIMRVFTADELKARELAAAKAEVEKEAKLRAERAKQVAWDESRAGQLCKKYLSWTKEECQDIADKKIWMGMTKEQAIESVGRPHNINRTVGSWGVH